MNLPKLPALGFAIAMQLLLATGASGSPPPVTFTVNSNADIGDANPGNGICDDGVGVCTLRAAVMEANRYAGDVTIELPSDIYTLSAPVSGLGEYTGALKLTTPASGSPAITISGAGSATTIIDGNGSDRVLTVAAGRTALIRGVTVRNGNNNGILNHGVLTLSAAVVRDNAGAVAGGGIGNVNQLGVYNSTITMNSANYGGGVSNYIGAGFTAVNSAIDSNHANNGGGVENNGVMVMRNSTVSANQAEQNGGGIDNNGGTSNIYNSTIVFNLANASGQGYTGGGIANNGSSAAFTLRNTVIAGNTLDMTGNSDCTGTFDAYGSNRLGTGAGCTLSQIGAGVPGLLGSLAELGPLQYNGGLTRTHAPVPPSSLIGGGVACVDSNNLHIATDQRGRPRPPSPANPLNSTCDIGAFEYNEVFFDGFQ